MQLVTWYPVLDHLQLTTQRELAKLEGLTVTTVVGRAHVAVRAKQGWAAAEMDDLAPVSLEGPGWWARGLEVLRAHPDAVHLFNTMWTDPRFLPLILWAAARGHRLALLSEPYSDTVEGYFADQPRWRGALLKAARPPMYRTAGVALGRAMGVVFAISPKAMAQYARAGFRRETIRPYGYFVRPAIAEGPVGARIAGALRLVYVGALIERKGLDVLARAVGICRAAGLDVTADLYGSGDASRWTGEGVVHRGTIPVGQAPATMRRYDAVVLPSRYDGWGAVVNEALQQGVPVLASDNVGASALVRASGAGGVFGATEVEGLVALVRRAIAERELLEEWRGRAAAYRPHLDPAVAAGYVRDCLVAHYAGEAAPVCPWY